MIVFSYILTGLHFIDMNLVEKGKTRFGELGETLFTRRVWRATKLRGKFENLQYSNNFDSLET